MTTSTRVNAYVRASDDGSLTCTHCHHELPGTAASYPSELPFYEGLPRDAGPHIFPDPSVYVDARVVFRQYYCPGCYIALHTEVVPA
jgi:N-methylhydantoinase B